MVGGQRDSTRLKRRTARRVSAARCLPLIDRLAHFRDSGRLQLKRPFRSKVQGHRNARRSTSIAHGPDTHLERAEPRRSVGPPARGPPLRYRNLSLRLFGKAPVSASSPGWLLVELKSAHERVLSGLAELDRLLERPMPDIQAYLALRARLSSATRARNSAVQAAHNYILERADQATEAELARLFQARRKTLGLSAEHLSTWNSWAITASWSRHRSAQRALRSHWVDLIELEQGALYPMLARHTGSTLEDRRQSLRQ